MTKYFQKFHSIGIIRIFAKKLLAMIRIKTDESILLSFDDSKQLVEFSLKRKFEKISDFLKCEDIKLSDYWGDVYLIGTENDYFKWITQIAVRILKV